MFVACIKNGLMKKKNEKKLKIIYLFIWQRIDAFLCTSHCNAMTTSQIIFGEIPGEKRNGKSFFFNWMHNEKDCMNYDHCWKGLSGSAQSFTWDWWNNKKHYISLLRIFLGVYVPICTLYQLAWGWKLLSNICDIWIYEYLFKNLGNLTIQTILGSF